MTKINPCLWFDSNAEEAAKFYTSVFKHSEMGKVAKYGDAGAQVSGQKKDSVMTVEFTLENLKFLGLNGGPIFRFSPGISFFVWCESENEITDLWKQLSRGNQNHFELKKYPWAEKYGWCTDQYGVSWQLMLAKHKSKLAPAFLFTGSLVGKAEEAMHFYMSQFKNSKINTIHRDPKTNHVMFADFTLDGQDFVMMEGDGEKHKISQATSLIVYCKTQEEVDHYWDKLSAGGTTEQCGWLKDKYGISWQITPEVIGEIMSSSHRVQSEKAMQAMLKMKKIDIAKIEQAFRS